jgi:hypothetical protein
MPPLEDPTGHTCIFVDVKCMTCNKNTVFTMEFSPQGCSQRIGYYHKHCKLVDQISIEPYQLVHWSGISDIFDENVNFGAYKPKGNNG